MTAPLMILAESHCCEYLPNNDSAKGALFLTGAAVDTVISLTALVVGILALCAVITAIPAVVAYSLIGLSAAITMIWIGFLATHCKE